MLVILYIVPFLLQYRYNRTIIIAYQSIDKMDYQDIIKESERELERMVAEKLNELEFGIIDEET